jgi:hypothetical protein
MQPANTTRIPIIIANICIIDVDCGDAELGFCHQPSSSHTASEAAEGLFGSGARLKLMYLQSESSCRASDEKEIKDGEDVQRAADSC